MCGCERGSPVCAVAIAVRHMPKRAGIGRGHCSGTASEVPGTVALQCLLAGFRQHTVLAIASSPQAQCPWWQQLHNFCVAAYFRKPLLPLHRVM